MKKQNLLIKILLFPINLIKYASLGSYYILYGLLYPFLFIWNKIGDGIFNIYQKQTRPQNIIEEISPEEAMNLNIQEEEEQKEETEEEKKVEQRETIKPRKEKDLAQNALLISALQNDNERSEVPLTFQYTAIDEKGKKVVNTFFAYSKMEVYTYLTNENYLVLDIKTSKFIELVYGPSKLNIYKFKNKDLIFWLTQLSTYIKAGIPLTESMRILNKQMSKSGRKKRIFDSIIYYLTMGESFSSALEKQNNTFPALLISMIKTAEATGELEETLDDMANYYTEAENTRKAMISAMSYPSMLIIFAFAVVAFIMLYVIPSFEDVYASSGATLNGYTLFILNASKYFEKNFATIIASILATVIGFILLYKNIKSFRKTIQTILMNIPVFGKIIIFKEVNIFAKTFASLLKNNVFITDSMNLLTEITNNEIYKGIMIKTINNIAAGDKISTSFKDHWAVPDVAYYMIVTGESTGELATMMSKVAQHYQTEHKTIINNMKSFIEPVMIVFLAVVVGGIVLAVILPMFSLYGQIA